MLKTVLITPDRDLSNRLREMLSDSGVATLGRALEDYPSEKELEGFLRANCPSIVFLDLIQLTLALAAANKIEIVNPGTQIVALSSERSADVLVATMRAGIREIVPLPLEERPLLDAVARARETLMRRPIANQTTDRLFCFMPAKPGNGASTIAVNASLALARLAPQKTLLLDLDVNHGVTSFLLKLTNPHSIRDAMENSLDLDDSLWSGMVESRENLDV
jgi:pilus assembly protein CpaE